MSEQITESVRLGEAESLGQGRYRVLVIDAGEGSSGTYPAETLREAASKRLVTQGTHSYINHPSQSEDADRPERSVRDLIGVFTSDAVFDEARQGLVADYKVFSPYREVFAEWSEHVGLSIRGDGEVEMREGKRVITALEHISSVDVVTRAGRGGKVLSLLESARPAFDADDMAAATGVPNDATPTVPADMAEAVLPPPHSPKEAPVAELSEAEVAQLRTSVTEAEAARDAALAEAAAANARVVLFEAQTAARPVTAAKVAESKTLGARTQARLVEAIVSGLPMTDGKVDEPKLSAAIEAAVTAAEAEVADYRASTQAPVFGTFGSVTEAATVTESAIDLDAAVGSAFGRKVN